jgi:glycosyltransferase involved in cell wall biosynthesis
MRIGIDARVLQGERRGQWRYAYCLINALLKADKVNEYVLFYHGFRVQPFALKDRENLKQVWCRIPGRILKPLWSAFFWPKVDLLMNYKIDVFHNLLNYNRVYFTPLPAKRMVATYHGIAGPKILYESFNYRYRETIRWLKKLRDSADRIILISNLVKQNLLEYVSIPEEKMRVVYCGVEDSFKVIHDAQLINKSITKYGLEKKKFFLYLGGMERNKNLETLLAAFSPLADKYDIYLVLAGEISPSRIVDLKKICDRKVIFPGRINEGDILALYNAAFAFVLPTIFEGFGLPVLEAMACGTPVVASKNTGVLEVVGDAVLQFNPDEKDELARALRLILEDEGLYARLKKEGLAKAREMFWEKTAKDTISVYEELK